MKKFFTKSTLVAGSAILGATSANAAALLTAPTLNTEDGVVVAGAVLAGLAVFWGVKKAISLLRA